MKKLLILFAGILFISTDSSASHIYGGEMSYTHISGNTYRVDMVLYRECNAINLPNFGGILAQGDSTCNGGVVQAVLPFVGFTPLPLNMCDTTVNQLGCNGPGLYGIESWHYSGLITLPSACVWEVSYSSCCLTPSTTNIANPGSVSIHVGVTIDNQNFPGNSSPDFNFEPLTSFCNNVLNCYNHSASDVDGDSIVYTLVDYLPAAYATGFSGTNPLPTTSGVSLDATNGIMTMTPNQLGRYLMVVEASEYRNGALIGSISRMMIYPVFVGTFPPVNYVTGTIFTDQNGNSMLDAGEPGVPNIVVQGSPVAAHGTSNAAGQYGIAVPAGTSTITVLNPPKYHTISPASHTVTTTGVCAADSGRHFALTPIPGISDVCVSLNQGAFARPGRTTRNIVKLQNVGTDTANGQIFYYGDTATTYVSSNPTANVITGNDLVWNYSALLPGECRYYTVDHDIDTSQALLSELHNAVFVTPVAGDSDVVNNLDSLIVTVFGAFDPNDKQVEPSGAIDINDVAAGMWLDYKVRFQNTGSDTAFYVLIVDTLDANLDLSTIEFTGSSHPYTLNMTGASTVKWEFNNILLPDSTTDEVGSHGFVSYRIKPKTNLMVGTTIKNAADIFFDFNVPIKTNRAINTVTSTVSIDETKYTDRFVAFPNPNDGLFTLRFDEKPTTGAYIVVNDLLGREVARLDATNRLSMQIDLSDQANGMYIVSFRSFDKMSSQRIIISK